MLLPVSQECLHNLENKSCRTCQRNNSDNNNRKGTAVYKIYGQAHNTILSVISANKFNIVWVESEKWIVSS